MGTKFIKGHISNRTCWIIEILKMTGLKISNQTTEENLEFDNDDEHNRLLNSQEDEESYGAASSSNDPVNDRVKLSSDLKNLIKSRLYVSHFLCAWNSRVYEFGIVLFIINLYPGTLFPSSLFAFCSSLSGIVLSNFVTNLVNHGARLKIIKDTIFIQRSFAVISASMLLIIFQFFKDNELLKRLCLIVVIICGVVEKLCTIANKISISRDWVVKICAHDEKFLIELNSKLRGIDLFCKLVAPLFISSFITFAGFRIALIFIILVFLISSQVEFSMILRMYHSLPMLKGSEDHITKKGPKFKPMSYGESLKMFIKNPLALQILSVSFIYLQVLSFGNTTIAYLLTFDDINNFSIGLLKGISTVFELFGTLYMFPLQNNWMNFINVGAFSVSFQLLSLLPIFISFIMNYSKTHWLVCVCIPWSRIGRWCFDLAVQNSIQIYVADDLQRFNLTSFEESLHSLFELTTHMLTLIFHKPEQFKYPVYASICALAVSTGLYWLFVIFISQKKIELSK